MWGGPASGFRAFSGKNVSLPREVRVIPKLRGSRDAPGRCRAQTTLQNRRRGGNNRRRKSRGRDEHNRRRLRERKSRRAQTRPGEKQPTPQRTTPSRTATAAARGARQAMFRRIHPALLLKQTRRAPPFRPQKRDTPRALRTKKGVPQNRSSAERLTVTAQGLPGASIAPSPTG